MADSSINWSLLSGAQAPLANPVDALRAGQAMDDDRQNQFLKAQKQNADLAAASRLAQAQQQAGQLYGQGDTRGSQAAMISGGVDPSMITATTGADKQGFDERQTGLKAVYGMAQHLSDQLKNGTMTPDDVSTFVAHNKPLLMAAGAHPDDIDTIVANPGMVGAVAAQGATPTEQNASAVAQQNANTTAAHLPIDQQAADTARMAELRQEQTPVGISGTDNVYLPGGAQGGASGTPDFNVTVGGGHANLTGMNLGQAIDYGRNVLIPQTRGNASLGLSNGQGSSAMGAFQITQGTLAQYAPKVFGANWQSVPFTPQNQDKLAEAIFDANKSGNLKSQWTSLPNSAPGAYANMPWSQARNLIMAGESGGSVRGPTMLAAATPKGDPNAAKSLDPAALDDATWQFISTGVMPSLGQGSAVARAQIMNRKAELQRQYHISDDTIVGNTAGYAADARTLKTLQQQHDLIVGNEGAVKQNFAQWLAAKAKLPAPNAYPAIQAVVNPISQQLGGTSVGPAETARRTAVDEYARVMTAGGTSAGHTTDSATKNYDTVFQSNASLGQAQSVVSQATRDMENRKAALEAQIATTNARIASRSNPRAYGGATAQTQTASRAQPQVGAIVKGYRFNGGNPADRNAWSRV